MCPQHCARLREYTVLTDMVAPGIIDNDLRSGWMHGVIVQQMFKESI